MLKTKYCGGGHLGFSIPIKKKIQLCKGPSNNHMQFMYSLNSIMPVVPEKKRLFMFLFVS